LRRNTIYPIGRNPQVTVKSLLQGEPSFFISNDLSERIELLKHIFLGINPSPAPGTHAKITPTDRKIHSI
jgi:hypothetical protein